MTTSWASPDSRPRASGTPFTSPPVPDPRPPLRRDAWAGLLTVVVNVLVGAPVGLLWAHLAPSVRVVVEGEQVQVLDTYGDGFIAVDGCFLVAASISGLVAGALAHRLAARHGPAVVLGLALGGLAGAWVATAVGELVGADEVRRLVAAQDDGSATVAVRLRALPAVVGWPVAALVTYLVLAVRRPDQDVSSPDPDVSSG